MKKTILIVRHGSRDAAANAEFEDLVARYRALRPEDEVAHAYIELALPSLQTALDETAGKSDDVVVVPLMLFAAGHVKNDIPLALDAARKKFPGVRFTACPALGVHPKMTELAFERLSSMADVSGEQAKRAAVIVVGRGSSDPDANGDFCKLARVFGEGRGFSWVQPAFIGITRPSFEEAIELVARARPERLMVVPYFLFGGLLIAKLQEQVAKFSQEHSWIKTAMSSHLGVHPKLLEMIDERVQEARGGGRPLPCDGCQYRTALPGLSENVGGLKALLWSVRHSFTHSQAAPHIHAHKPVRKHLFVCTNVDCAAAGSGALLDKLRRLIRDAGRRYEFQVTRTSCMGKCGEGPIVAVYPDGIWYRGVKEEDADEIVDQHLFKDKIVSRLVDNIMQ